MPSNICPKCSVAVPVRKACCSNCHHVFAKRGNKVFVRTRKQEMRETRSLQASDEKLK